MNLNVPNICAPFLMLLIASCEKPYFPNDLDADEKIPVIHGAVYNQPGPYEASVFWASPFGSEKPEPIEDATVFIHDDLGKKERLAIVSPGYYQTTNEHFTGTPGRTYKLSVALSNGEVYESTPARLETAPMTYSLYHQIGAKEDYETNHRGQFIIFTHKGLDYYIDMTADSARSYYYYYTSRVVSQFITRGGTIIYSWEISYLDALPNTKATVTVNDAAIIKGHKLGFLVYYENRDVNPDPVITPSGWTIQTNIYSVSKEVFDYYQAVAEQASSDNQIFDPIPSQIKGNIKCVTDTAKAAFGVFEVAEKFSEKIGVSWWPGTDTIKRVELPADYKGPEFNGQTTNIPPDFWVEF